MSGRWPRCWLVKGWPEDPLTSTSGVRNLGRPSSWHRPQRNTTISPCFQITSGGNSCFECLCLSEVATTVTQPRAATPSFLSEYIPGTSILKSPCYVLTRHLKTYCLRMQREPSSFISLVPRMSQDIELDSVRRHQPLHFGPLSRIA